MFEEPDWQEPWQGRDSRRNREASCGMMAIRVRQMENPGQGRPIRRCGGGHVPIHGRSHNRRNLPGNPPGSVRMRVCRIRDNVSMFFSAPEPT